MCPVKNVNDVRLAHEGNSYVVFFSRVKQKGSCFIRVISPPDDQHNRLDVPECCRARGRCSVCLEHSWPGAPYTAPKISSAGLGNFPPHAPGSRLEDKCTVFTISEQAPAHARFERSAAFVGE